MRAIRLTPPDMPLDMVLHTPGGLVLAAEQIAGALKRHPGRVTVLIPSLRGVRGKEGLDVLLVNPRLVQTGLDPVDFPTIV